MRKHGRTPNGRHIVIGEGERDEAQKFQAQLRFHVLLRDE